MIPCNKKDGGLRPIVLGEVLRNIISNCVLLQAALPIKSQLDPEQYGVKPSGQWIQVPFTKLKALPESWRAKSF